jgi:hypothetical protein
MLRSLAIAVLITSSLSANAVQAQEWATKMFETTDHDFGSVARGATAEYRFVLSNLYMENVHITGVASSCGCTTPRVEPDELRTYEKGAIVAHFNTDRFQGQRGATLTVSIDRPYPAEVQLHVKGYIRNDVAFEPGSVQLGDIARGAMPQRRITVTHDGWGEWKILDVRGINSHVSADLVETGRNYNQVSYALNVQLNRDAPVGYLNEQIVLVTNDPQSPQIPLKVEGHVESPITVSPATLFLGVVESGNRVTKQLVVKGKKPFRIVSITCNDGSFEFGKENDATAKAIHVIPVTFVASGSTGKIQRSIHITTDQGDEVPDLAAYAVVNKAS